MKMKELGLLFMMLCMVFAVNAQELKKGDKLPDLKAKIKCFRKMCKCSAN